MKVFACVLLCFAVAVQGRSSGVNTSRRQLANPGENPGLVHLRLATGSSGSLRTCAGSLIDNSWVLTTAQCALDHRFVWLRYGAVNVINPSLVTESSTITSHPAYNPFNGNNNVALIHINRIVHDTGMFAENRVDDFYAVMRKARAGFLSRINDYAPIRLAADDVELPEKTTFCRYGAEGDNSPGEQLTCIELELDEDRDEIFATSDEGDTTQYDNGAPLVINGVQVGILTGWSDNWENRGRTTFIKPAEYISWINSVTGLDL